MARVQQKRGLKAALPSSGLLAGEIYLTTDQQTGHFATDATTMVPMVPAVDLLPTLATVDGAADFVTLWDTSETTTTPFKKMTFTAFKSALNIPAASSDELVAVASGAAAGYLWGTDGTDGVLRMGTTMSWVRSGSFATINVETIDCGTF